MPNPRKIIFSDEEVYHICNRGLDKRPTFTTVKEYERALQTIQYYQFINLPLKLSKYLTTTIEIREGIIKKLYDESQRRIELLAYCFMPNHFHFLIRQKQANGVSSFIADFTNSYTKYFNAKHERTGPLFQGLFRAVHTTSDEQLIHNVRYIMLNPVTAYLMQMQDLANYKYSSYYECFHEVPFPICTSQNFLSFFPGKQAFRSFIEDQVGYARELKKITHVIHELEK